jgi:GNAT superfamily N-acetyltransferase
VADVVVTEADFDSPAVQDLLAEFNRELLATVPGFSPSGGSTVQTSDFAHPNGVFLVARDEYRTPLGCGGLRKLTEATAEVKRLYVRGPARGSGVGRTLLRGLETRARTLGVTEVVLDTMGGEPAALDLFRSAGYELIADYNANQRAKYWFGKRLSGPDTRA